MRALSLVGGWDRALRAIGSTRLRNPDPEESNWEADCAYLPRGRDGPLGDVGNSMPYPSLVVEVASSESTEHVLNKGWTLLSHGTTIQIVVIILIRPHTVGAQSLQLWKLQRDRLDVHYEMGDPNCTVPGDPNFQLRLPVRLLFEGAPIPPALVEVENMVLDLFAWKSRFLDLP